MTTRVQALRSSTTQAVPAAGTRLPGELWTNFPDLQLGVIDASKNAQKLVGVRFFSATANYAVGDFVIQAGVLYVAKVAVTAGAFNATQWTQVAAATDPGGPYLSVASGPYLPIAGGTLTGPLVLAADPGAALGAATKQYVDGKVSAAPFLPLAGGTMTGLVTLSGPPTIPLHAATKAYVDSGAFLPIAGGTMTGPIVLAANPAAPLQPATKQYVDALPAAMNDNRIINGDMRIDQRNNGASGTAINVYTTDRWYYAASTTGKGTWQRAASAAPGLTIGFGYSLLFLSSSAYVAPAAEAYCWQQAIEADLIADFAWGTPNAQPVTLSFWANSSLTGTFSGAIVNQPSPSTRSYPFTFNLPTASTWTKIAVTIPGDTGGPWVLQGNAAGLMLRLDLGSGASFRGPANAWAAAGYAGVTGSVSIVAVNGASFNVTGVKLEIGSVATPFNRQSLAKSMADCQRYYQTGQFLLNVGGSSLAVGAGQSYNCGTAHSTAMRANATMTAITNSSTNLSVGSLNDNGSMFYIIATATASGMTNINLSFSASAEL
jgi:hypothetical protein